MSVPLCGDHRALSRIRGLDCLRSHAECLGDCPDAAYFGPHVKADDDAVEMLTLSAEGQVHIVTAVHHRQLNASIYGNHSHGRSPHPHPHPRLSPSPSPSPLGLTLTLTLHPHHFTLTLHPHPSPSPSTLTISPLPFHPHPSPSLFHTHHFTLAPHPHPSPSPLTLTPHHFTITV